MEKTNFFRDQRMREYEKELETMENYKKKSTPIESPKLPEIHRDTKKKIYTRQIGPLAHRKKGIKTPRRR